MTTYPNMQHLVEQHGMYSAIPPETWQAFDRAVTEWNRKYRADLPKSGERTRGGR